MERVILKHSRSLFVIFVVLYICIHWLSIIFKERFNIIDAIIGILISTIMIVIAVFYWGKSIGIESDRIVIYKILKSVILYKKDLLEVMIKSRSIVLIKSNGIKYELRLNFFKREDIIFIKTYFDELNREVLLAEEVLKTNHN